MSEPMVLPVRIPVKPKKSKRSFKRLKISPSKLKITMTVLMGVGIPLLSLAMSKLAGTLAVNGMYLLAFLALSLMVSILSVSLSHLAWAIENITRSPWQASWAMAVSLDMSLVLCELVHVYASTLGLEVVTNTVMVSVALASMALNVWAFLMHK